MDRDILKDLRALCDQLDDLSSQADSMYFRKVEAFGTDPETDLRVVKEAGLLRLQLEELADRADTLFCEVALSDRR